MDTDALVTVVRRAPALSALAEGPMDRQDLQERLDVSRPTVHRLTRALDEEGLARRVDGEFVLTPLGEEVADRVASFERDLDAARRLSDLLGVVREAPVEFDVRHFADATVTRAGPGKPYAPVSRFMELVGKTASLRGMDPASINPLHVDDVHRAIVNGMETDAIFQPDVVAELLANNPERARDAFESGNLTLSTMEDVPFGLTLCDDRVGVGVYEQELGMLEVYVDTDDRAAYEWAEDVFETYRAAADPIDWPEDAPDAV